MTALDEYIYEVLGNENDARVCAQLLAEEFVKHNPMIIFDRLTSQRMFEEDTWPSMIDVLDERLSFLARHRPSHEIVGTITACDLYLAQKKHPYDPSGLPSLVPSFDLLDELTDTFVRNNFNQELKPNMVLQVIMGATRAEHTGKGVGSGLRTFMFNYARDVRGFQYGLVQPTNQATYHICVNKMNGKVMTTIDPKT